MTARRSVRRARRGAARGKAAGRPAARRAAPASGAAAAGRGTVFVVSAPSGAGKTTLCRRLLAEVPGIEFSVSCTTRAARPDERDGVDYRFLAREEFERRRRAGEFLEWARVGDHLYGTSAAVLAGTTARGIDVLLDLDTQGAASIRRLLPAAVLIFILPPDREALRARLRQRGSETPAAMERRLGLAAGEIRQAGLYDYVVVNDDLEAAYRSLSAIVLAARCRAARQAERVAAAAASFGVRPRRPTGRFRLQ
jgi:guanylate kinase